MKKPRGGKAKAKAAPKAPLSPSTKRIDKIREAIEACADRTGRIDPVAVWRAARDPANPLHSEFEWDTKKAAEKHWTDTARRLIREIKFTVILEDRKIVAPYYVADPRSPGRYSQTVRIATREDIAQRVLRDEVDRIESSIQRARALALSFELSSELEKMLAIATHIRQLIDDDVESPVRTAEARA